MRRIPVGAVLLSAAALLVGCHTITEELPTEPTTTEKPATTGLLTVPIPALTAGTTTTPTPAPSATPAPTPGTPAPAPPPPAPTPEPTPEPPPSGGGGVEGCGEPLPPPLSEMKAKIHLRGAAKWTLDSTPIVGGREYCKKIGFIDGRTRCPVRPEGHPERHACERYAVGRAQDTGRTGPTWTRNSKHCKGKTANGCENHPDNQYLLWAFRSGYYQACAKGGVCGSVEVDR